MTSSADRSPAPRLIDAETLLAACPMADAVAALQRALREGLDPEAGAPRSVVPVEHGQLLLMPAASPAYAGVKVATVAPGNANRGLPRVQGHYLLFAADTLTPVALLDGAALTTLRTAACSGAAVDLLAPADARRLVLFGTGPQAFSHLDAIRAVRPVEEVIVVGRTPERSAAFVAAVGDAGPTVRAGTADAVAEADLVVCCTTAREPLFDGELLRAGTTVVAMGAHEPDAREIDDATVAGATVVVEARSAALREAGPVIIPHDRGLLDADDLLPLAELARGATVPSDRSSVFVSVGMPWEDLVVASAAYDALEPSSAAP